MSRILIVDDSPITWAIVKKALAGDYDCEFREVGNGRQALEVYQTWRPTLVILDLIMPVMNGFEMLEKLMSLDPDARVLVLTSDVQPRTRQMILDGGARGVLYKPIKKAELQDAIREVFA